MQCYCIITKDGDNRPCHFYLETQSGKVNFDIYRKNSKLKLKTAFERVIKAKELITWAAFSDLRTNNYKDLIDAFDLSLFTCVGNIRDYGLTSVKTLGSAEKDLEFSKRLVEYIKTIGDKPYQKLIAGAQQVYSNISRKGLILNYTKMFPNWSWDTFSGRSKCTGFNIQGWSTPDVIYQPDINFNCVQIQFDWICADIRVASILSGDSALNASFNTSDPYTYLSNEITGKDDSVRDEAKLLLLRTINSLDHSNEIITRVFPKLSEWLHKIYNQTRKEKSSSNIVGRSFHLSGTRDEKSILNAIMQGSVASGIQNVLIEINKKFPNYIITDIHDSIVMSVPNDKEIVKMVISEIGPLFLRPFKNILPDDLVFPYRVSIGTKWKDWKKCLEVRN
jgi:hypothetical protein